MTKTRSAIRPNSQSKTNEMDEYLMTTITLGIETETLLALLMHIDGTINRKGDGSMKIDNKMFMGITDEKIFQELMKYITDEFKDFFGKVYDLPNKQGKTCSIEIILGKDNGTDGVKFIYGSDSMGPPRPVAEFVEAAILITNPWFYKQKKDRK